MKQNYIWLLNESSDRGLWFAALASLAVHGVLFAILAATSIFFPTIGNADNFDVLWNYAAPTQDEPNIAPVAVEPTAPHGDSAHTDGTPAVAEPSASESPAADEKGTP